MVVHFRSNFGISWVLSYQNQDSGLIPMAHAPGSFSKNFAWHGTGLRKLHTTIRNGFNETLSPVDRYKFRSQADVDSANILIPMNFFLHNRDGQMSIDELVFQAIKRGYSNRFDRLALFALNLNRVGGGRDSNSGREIVSRPAMWANEFVRERLWSEGKWQTSALREPSLDQFLAERMVATDSVRVKCRNNYRHIFQLCGITRPDQTILNSRAEEWIGSALFLAWDRHILDGGAQGRSSLLDLIDSDEIYKLLGVTRDYALDQAESLAELYANVRHLRRFKEAIKAEPKKVPAPASPMEEVPKQTRLEWLEQEQLDRVVERRSVESNKQIRDRKRAAALKIYYNNTCQFCGTQLQVSDNHFYSEAAHIKGLGEPHNGPDIESNMLVLCPNHHLQFDRGFLRLRRVGNDYLVSSAAADDALRGKKITLMHNLEYEYVKYHYDWFS